MGCTFSTLWQMAADFQLIFNYYAHHGGWVRVPDPPPSWSTSSQELILSNYGHTQVKPPHPVRSAQLNTWWQSQYYGGGPHGNTLCCNFFFFFFSSSWFCCRKYYPSESEEWPKICWKWEWEVKWPIILDHCCFAFDHYCFTFDHYCFTFDHMNPNRALPTLPAPASSARYWHDSHDFYLNTSKYGKGRGERGEGKKNTFLILILKLCQQGFQHVLC